MPDVTELPFVVKLVGRGSGAAGGELGGAAGQVSVFIGKIFVADIS